MTARPKQNAVRSEAYRRLVASMPCKACGIQDYSQAAHTHQGGKGIKADDRDTFALCCPREGVEGCHADFDQYRMFPKHTARIVGAAWAADTRRAIKAAGKWPAKLPKFEEGETA
jgi:hypothetical protein